MADGVLFPYLEVKNILGETAWRPILPFTLIYHGNSLNVAGLVDTGADVNVLPYKIGLALGAIWEQQNRMIELSGNLAQYEARGIIVSAQVASFSPVQLAFAWTRAEHVPMLLGQINFLREFNVCFFGKQKEFELQLRATT